MAFGIGRHIRYSKRLEYVAASVVLFGVVSLIYLLLFRI